MSVSIGQSKSKSPWSSSLGKDITAGIVVFLVALPLCLGIALASNAPLFAGILSGIIGGIVVGLLSGSQTSVSGPAAGLTAIVATQIAVLGNFETFLMAVALAGLIQIGLGTIRAGIIAAFFPSSVIKGLLAAIGVILILKQLPYVLGHQSFTKEHVEIEGDLTYNQPGHENPFTSLLELLDGEYHLGPLLIGLFSIAFLVGWDKVKVLKKSPIPSPLLVVVMGVLGAYFFNSFGGMVAIGAKQHVQVPVAQDLSSFLGFLTLPNFASLQNPAVFVGAFTIAIVATLETLLNLEAVDKIDPKRRESPANRELVAQGIGNLIAGCIGGLPMTSVIVRSSVNINAGGQSKLSAIIHGFFLLGFVFFIPNILNMIPLSCLAAILMVTGFKLASPKLVQQLYAEGRYQFLPFVVTVIAIVMTDLLIGILIGLGVALAFILYSNYRRPVRRVMEKHIGGDVLHIELANQVSFLNRAALERTLRSVKTGGHVLLDARQTDYIDPDILSLIRDFKDNISTAHGVQVSLRGFRPRYNLSDDLQFVDYSTRELQEKLTPKQVCKLLLEGNQRFRSDERLHRNLLRQVLATSTHSYPMAAILSCMDARLPPETIFDLGIGDVFNIRLAGNALVGPKVLASCEFACTAGGAKLIVVLGHTKSVVISQAIEAAFMTDQEIEIRYGKNFRVLVDALRPLIHRYCNANFRSQSENDRLQQVNLISRDQISEVVHSIAAKSERIRELADIGQVGIVGAIYDVHDGRIEILNRTTIGFDVDELVSEVVSDRATGSMTKVNS